VLVPLALAGGASTFVLRGGTHVEWSPPFDDLVNSYFPILRRLGFRIDVELKCWGWYPVGEGEIAFNTPGGFAETDAAHPRPIELLARGSLLRITGRAVAANLPAHIPQRMADRAREALGDLGVPIHIPPERVTAASPGAGIFLVAKYEQLSAAFSAYGRLGKPSEAVADEAVAAFREHHASKAAVERHLADQLLLPLALAAGASTFTTPQSTSHLMTNAWTVGQFGIADISITEETSCVVRIEPRLWR
jgi:RNA 3'-terminal phosphate cyclase (ATP)